MFCYDEIYYCVTEEFQSFVVDAVTGGRVGQGLAEESGVRKRIAEDLVWLQVSLPVEFSGKGGRSLWR